MNYDLLFVGAGTTAFGTLLGAWLAARLTFGFQKQLLKQQLDFLKKQAEEDAALRRAIFLDWHTAFKDFDGMVSYRAAQILERLPPRNPPS